MGYLPLSLLIDLRKLTFLFKLKNTKNNLLCSRLLVEDNDAENLCVKYNLSLGNDRSNWKVQLFNHFKCNLENGP